MIDFHSHILPHMDDGAQNVQISLDMLADSYLQGVRTVVATPHCIITKEEDIDIFLERRNDSYKELMSAIALDERDFPDIVLGCEAQIAGGITNLEKMRELCIFDTNYILIEMPYKKWNEDNFDHLYSLLIKGMKPIIAHIERYMNRRNEFHNFYALDLIYQVNADSFLSPFLRRNIPDLFTMGSVQLLGSDMHNLSRRPSRMGFAKDRIIKSYGIERFNLLMENAELVLKNEPVERIRYEQMSFFKKLKV